MRWSFFWLRRLRAWVTAQSHFFAQSRRLQKARRKAPRVPDAQVQVLPLERRESFGDMSIAGTVAVAGGGALAVLLNQALQAATTPVERVEAPDANRPGQHLGGSVVVDASGTPLAGHDDLLKFDAGRWDIPPSPVPSEAERRQDVDRFFRSPQAQETIGGLGQASDEDGFPFATPVDPSGNAGLPDTFHSQPVKDGSGGGNGAIDTGMGGAGAGMLPSLKSPSNGGSGAPQAPSSSPANANVPSSPNSTNSSLPPVLSSASGTLSSSSNPNGTGNDSSAATASLLQSYSALPISFEANQGQAPSQFQFVAHGSGYGLYLGATGATLVLTPPATSSGPSAAPTSPSNSTSAPAPATVVQMQLVGANPAAQAVGANQLPGVANYFVGNDPSQWHTNIPTYEQVQYLNVYQGIDLVYASTSQGNIEFSWVVHPGADVSQIRLAFTGVQGLSIDPQGNLALPTAGGTVTEQAPVLYQLDAQGNHQTVSGNYVVKSDGTVGISVGTFDPTRALVIDPTLSYSTYLGGSDDDASFALAIDSSGNAYAVGHTVSNNFPTLGPAQSTRAGHYDTFVSKLNAAGTALVYSTYIGGNDDDDGYAVAVDASGDAYVAGVSFSTNFPAVNAFQSAPGDPGLNGDAYLFKLNSTGNTLVYSTYLGGSGQEFAYGVALSSSSNAIVTGFTTSANFPTLSALQSNLRGSTNAFLTEFSTSGSALVFSTYLGGSGDDDGNALALDSAGDIYLAGDTTSTNFPTLNAFQSNLRGSQNGFVTELKPNASALLYSTYLGGSGTDAALAVAVDSSDSAYITGYTDSTNFPTLSAFQSAYGGGDSNAFVTKLNSGGASLAYSTYLGGNGFDQGLAISLDGANNPYVVGLTSSPNFPTLHAVQSSYAGDPYDVFVAEFTSLNGALVYSTYVGGDDDDEGFGLGVDAKGDAYVSGYTASGNFPTANPIQGSYGGNFDAFVLELSKTTSSTSLAASPNPSVYGQLVTLTATVSGGGSSPTGAVSFFDGTTLLGSGNLVGGTASLTTAALAVGGHTLTARYGGDATYGVSTSSSVSQTVSQAATSTALSVSPSPAAVGDTVSFLATVIPTAPGAGVATGTVTFDDGSTVLGTGMLNGSDQATYSTAGLAAGPHTLTAIYGGDTNFSGSTSPVEPLTVIATWTLVAQGRTTDPTEGNNLPFNQAGYSPNTGGVSLSQSLSKGQSPSGDGDQQVTIDLSAGGDASASNSVMASGGGVTDQETANADLNLTATAQVNDPSAADFANNEGPDALVYNSATINNPVIEGVFSSDPHSPLPTSIQATLTWNGVAETPVTFTTTGHSAGDVYVLDVPVTATITMTNDYGWSLMVQAVSGTTTITRTATGSTPVIRANSSMGPGWTFGDPPQLTPFTGGVVWADDTGNPRVFTGTYPGSGTFNFTSPTDDFGTLSETKIAGVATFTYTAANKYVWTFNANGQATSLVSPQGLTMTLAYAGGNLSSVQQPDGGITTLTYSGGHVSTIVEPGNRTLTLSYNGSGQLSNIADATGALRTLSYNSSGLVTNDQWGPINTTFTYNAATGAATGIQQDGTTSYVLSPEVLAGLTGGGVAKSASVDVATVKDALGHVTTYILDSQGRVLSETQPDGTSMSQTFDADGNLLTSTDFNGHTTTYTYNASGDVTKEQDPDGEISSYTYNSFQEVLTQTNALGQTTTYTYNALGDRTLMTTPAGETTTYIYNTTGQVALLQTMIDPRGNRTTYTYNALRQMTSMENGAGEFTTYTYSTAGYQLTQTDPGGNVTTTIYDAKGQLVSETDALKNTTTYIYDAAGDQIAVTDARGFTTSYVYNGRGDQTVVNAPLGQTTTTVYDGNNNPVAVVDARGFTTTTVYDVNNRPIETINALGQITTTVYDANGNAIATVDALGRRTSTIYDSMNRPAATEDALGYFSENTYDLAGNLKTSTDANRHTTTYGYDADQRQVTVTDPMGNVTTSTYATGVLISTTDPEGHVTSYSYDGANRVIAVTDPLNHTMTTVYSKGNVVQTVSARGYTTSYVFDKDDRVIVTTDPNGNSTTTTYDADGNVLALTDARGYITTTTFDSLDRATVMTDPLGHATTTTYDADNDVVAVTDPLAHTMTVSYDALDRPLAQTDALKRTTTTTYDAVGNVIAVTDPLAHTTSYGFDADYRSVSVTDPLGNVTSSVYDPAGNQVAAIDPFGNTMRMAYDADNRLVATTDAVGNTTTNVYQKALLLATISPRGYTTTLAYDVAERQIAVTDPNGNITTTSYDADNNVIAVIDPKGFATSTTYDPADTPIAVTDPLGHITTTIYDADYNVAVTVDVLGRRTSYNYDAADRQTGMTDALTHLTTWTYDNANRLIAITDANGHTSSLGYDAANQQITGTDALGNVTTTTFDNAGRVTAVTDPLGHITSYVYDADDREIAVTDPNNNTTTSIYTKTELVAVTDARGNTTSYGYDADQRQITTTDALNETTTTTFDADSDVLATTDPRGFTTTNAYDPGDRLIAVTDALKHTTSYGYDKDGDVVTTTDPLGFVTTTGYDKADRAITVQTPSGGITTTTYDNVNNVIAVTDPLTHITSYGYDNLNRQITVTNALGYVTTTGYDAVGNVVQIVDADGNQTTYAYDSDNRQIGMTDSLGKHASWAYDKASRLTSSTDRDGQRINYSYDAGNRETGETWLSSTGATVNLLTYTYDKDNDQLTAANNAGTYTYTYDALDRPGTEQEPFSITLTYGYDASGNQTLVKDSFGGVTTSVYNAVDLLQTRELGGAGVTAVRTDFTYTARNQVASQSNSSSLTGSPVIGLTSYTYDAQGRLTLETYSTGGSTVEAYTYTYDLADRLTSEKIDGTLTSYGYDNANQLTMDGAITYGYDPTGNRKNTGYVTGTNNELLNDGTFTYTYDANGQTIAKKQTSNSALWSYTYDNHGQMLTATETSSTGLLLVACTYTYDVAGNRLTSAENQGGTTTTTHYAYDPNGNAWADLSSGNASQTRRVYGDNPDQVLARETSAGTVSYYVTDRLGSVRAITDNTGAVQDRITYDAFGNVTNETSPTFGDRYKGFGYQLDGVTGDYWDGVRVYRASDGRYYTQDPMGFSAGDPNLYRYVMNDPTNETDPTGMDGLPVDETERQRLKLANRIVDRVVPATANGGFQGTLTAIVQVLNESSSTSSSTPTPLDEDAKKFAAVWKRFAESVGNPEKAMTDAKGRRLQFYGESLGKKEGDADDFNTLKGITDRCNGDCDAWATFFVEELRKEGVKFDPKKTGDLMILRIGLKQDPRDAKPSSFFFMGGFVIPEGPKSNEPLDRIFAPRGSNRNPKNMDEYPYRNIIRPANDTSYFNISREGVYSYKFDESLPGDIKFNRSRAPIGQGNATPRLHFSAHVLVSYRGRLYDPGFGKEYGSVEEFLLKAVSGVGYTGTESPGTGAEKKTLYFKEPRLSDFDLNWFPYSESELLLAPKPL